MVEPFGGLAQGQSPQSPGPQPAGNGGQDNSTAVSLGRVARAMGVIANKNIPPKMKVELWNSSVSPELGKILGGAVIPSFSEWPEELDDYAKRANSILKEKSLSYDEKVAALKSLLATAEENFHNIRSRNPQAVVNAAKIIDTGRNSQQVFAEPGEEV
jgi:hypothetical protein